MPNRPFLLRRRGGLFDIRARSRTLLFGCHDQSPGLRRSHRSLAVIPSTVSLRRFRAPESDSQPLAQA
jgi:hypothetical protein